MCLKAARVRCSHEAGGREGGGVVGEGLCVEHPERRSHELLQHNLQALHSSAKTYPVVCDKREIVGCE